MSPVLRIAREEWRSMRRDRVAVTGVLLLVLLTLAAAFTAWDQRHTADAARTRLQARVDHEFDAQPDRHPHRMVHYGHFVFRTPGPLAAFDPGVEAFTGHTLFLEGHRQNSANFGDVRQSSLLLRFGQLTPAFVLQVLAPLLLVFLGHAAVARERETGTLRVLLAQGVRPAQLVAGKALALGGVATLVLLPALASLAALGLSTPGQGGAIGALAFGYVAWLAIWVVGIVAASAWLRRGRDALLVLLAAWTALVVAVPRLAAEVVAVRSALPTRFETDIAIARELAAIGDSHNPDDPYFAGFRKQVLARYGVARVEDLPVNYKGLVGAEGERLTSELFARHAAEGFERQGEQLVQVDRFAWLSPMVPLRRLSMAAAGTDLPQYRRFVEQAEHHRYALVQHLNRLQAEKLTLASDKSSRDNRIGREHWHGAADFHLEPEAPGLALRRALPAAGALVAWLVVLALLLVPAVRRLGKDIR